MDGALSVSRPLNSAECSRKRTAEKYMNDIHADATASSLRSGFPRREGRHPARCRAVHLELAGLCFIDIAGTRELIALMQSHPDLRLILHDPPESLRRLLALLCPGIHLEIRVRSTLVAGYQRRSP